MVVEGENVPHFSKMSGDKVRAPNGPSNVFHRKYIANVKIQSWHLLSGPPHPLKQHQ